MKMPRYPELDGWRGLSILFVLAGHLLPLGPSFLELNEAAATLGMVLFFTLSGFLITSTLIYRPNARDFLIRRVCRIVPLAWLFTILVLSFLHAPFRYFAAQLLFYSNLPPFWLAPDLAHFWSLCLEMQFYGAIALIFALFRRRGLYLLPVLCVAVTVTRILTQTSISIVTYKRADEILAGATLALLYEGLLGKMPRVLLSRIHPYFLFALLLVSCHGIGGPLDYARPYFASALVGATLLRPEAPLSLQLRKRWLAYLANISFALYVLHPAVHYGWLGTGSKVVRYAKAMPALVVVFGLAQLSTDYYEAFWINLGRRWTRGPDSGKPPAGASDRPRREPALTS